MHINTRCISKLYLWRIFAAVVVLAFVTALTPVTVFAQTVTLAPGAGPPGTAVFITGAGFVNGNTYSIRFAPGTNFDQVLVSGATVSGTTFTQVVNIPFAPRATYTLSVTTSLGNFSPSFTVVPVINLSSTTGEAGDSLAANGAGRWDNFRFSGRKIGAFR